MKSRFDEIRYLARSASVFANICVCIWLRRLIPRSTWRSNGQTKIISIVFAFGICSSQSRIRTERLATQPVFFRHVSPSLSLSRPLCFHSLHVTRYRCPLFSSNARMVVERMTKSKSTTGKRKTQETSGSKMGQPRTVTKMSLLNDEVQFCKQQIQLVELALVFGV